jgi:hypothetical protein
MTTRRHRPEAHHKKLLESVFPTPKPWAFHSQFGLGVSIARRYLPAPSIGEADTPGILKGGNRLIGQKIPRVLSLALTTDHKPQKDGPTAFPSVALELFLSGGLFKNKHFWHGYLLP